MTREILGQSPAVKALLKLIKQVCGAKTNILVIGESGTGKELVARLIHDSGPLKDKPFVAVNCGAIPENLIESEMFGHKRGSFTGAVSDKDGLFQVAHGGTLFLDEVGELPLGMQVKLLRAIQERTIRKVGGNENQKIDVRIIAATNRDLEAAVGKGTFREDLYYRLNVIQITTPPLRDRKGDVRILAEKFLDRYAQRSGKKVKVFNPEVMNILEGHSWPGNVRELENLVERAVTLTNGESISAEALPPIFRDQIIGSVEAQKNAASEIQVPYPDFSEGNIDFEKILSEVERVYFTEALAQAGGVKKKAALLLGMNLRGFRYRLDKLGMDEGD